MLQTTAPEPCTDPACRGGHAPGERLALVDSLCAGRGAQMTALRRQTLELLWEHGRPAGAYELVEALRRCNARPVAPPTVYRAIDFLIGQGLVAKIASRNAYVPRIHPERGHMSLFLVCRCCGSSHELEDRRVERLLVEDATAIGFRISRPVIELEGVCLHCSEAGGVA